eukprot:1178068-Prorocentrum_minimum.AAC.1
MGPPTDIGCYYVVHDIAKGPRPTICVCQESSRRVTSRRILRKTHGVMSVRDMFCVFKETHKASYLPSIQPHGGDLLGGTRGTNQRLRFDPRFERLLLTLCITLHPDVIFSHTVPQGQRSRPLSQSMPPQYPQYPQGSTAWRNRTCFDCSILAGILSFYSHKPDFKTCSQTSLYGKSK